MTDIAELVLRIKADAAQLERELKKATAATEQAGKKMSGSLGGLTNQFKALVPAITLGGIVALTKRGIDLGDALNDLNVKTGVSVETLSKLSLVAEQNGSSIEAFGQGFKFLQRNVAEAVNGNKQAAVAFTQLGLSVKQIQELSPEDQFLLIADRVSELGSEADRTKALMDLFGRSGADLAVIMKDGAAGIKAAMDEAERIGVVFTKEQAEVMDEFNDKWAAMAKIVEIDLATASVSAYDKASAFFGLVKANMSLASDMKSVQEIDLRMDALNKQKTSLEGSIARFGGKDQGFLSRLFDSPEDLAEAQKKLAAINDELSEAQRLRLGIMAKDGPYGPDLPGVKPKKGGRKLIRPQEEVKSGDDKQKEAEDYDKAGDALSELLTKYQQEAEFTTLSGRALEERRAEIEATTVAIKENALGASQEMIDKIKEQAGVTYEAREAAEQLKKSQDEAAESAREWRQKLTDGLTDIVMHFGSATDAARQFFDEIASQILRQKVTGPLAGAISTAIGGAIGGGFSLGQGIDNAGAYLGLNASYGPNLPARAAGGPVSGGMSYLVGEKGPEIFTPSMSGAITPNRAMGGQSINLYQNINLSPGLPETVAAGIMSARPAFRQDAMTAVLDALQKGGAESRLLRR